MANSHNDYSADWSVRWSDPEDFAENRMDIGPETIAKFKEIIKNAKTIVWNGPMGKFEEAPFDAGTRETLDAVTKSEAFTLMGGGESVQSLQKNGLLDKISFDELRILFPYP